jgi:hypothetical protein
MAAHFSPLYARLSLEHADSPVLARLARDHEPAWEVPLRVFGAVRYLELSGLAPDPWADFETTLAEHEPWIHRFVAERAVQTNEVQRSWTLLPAFLPPPTAARST